MTSTTPSLQPFTGPTTADLLVSVNYPRELPPRLPLEAIAIQDCFYTVAARYQGREVFAPQIYATASEADMQTALDLFRKANTSAIEFYAVRIQTV